MQFLSYFPAPSPKKSQVGVKIWTVLFSYFIITDIAICKCLWINRSRSCRGNCDERKRDADRQTQTDRLTDWEREHPLKLLIVNGQWHLYSCSGSVCVFFLYQPCIVGVFAWFREIISKFNLSALAASFLLFLKTIKNGKIEYISHFFVNVHLHS